MDFSAHVATVIGYFPFIVAIPAGIAVVCNHIDALKRHPKIVYASCGLLALLIAFLLSRLIGSPFKGVDCGVAGVLAALCFALAYVRVTKILTKGAGALLWRVVFLAGFAGLCLCFLWGDWKNWWSYGLLAALCTVSAVLLWRSSPLAKFPLYAATLYLASGALFGGIYNYVQNPALLQSPITFQVISWLIPGIPSLLLINCCLYARRIIPGDRKKG
jgi:hypothetical protein